MKYEKLVPFPTAPLLLGLLLALAGVAADKPAIPKADKGQAVAVSGPKKTESIDLGSGVKMEFVLIPAGSFIMGSDAGGPGENPAHRVTITKPFYLGKFEVTQAQWQTVMGANPSKSEAANLPVEMVSWNDCQSYLTRLQKTTGRKFTLPTEAQWEYACRAGTTTAYSFSDSDANLAKHAWFTRNSGNTTHPVGKKNPNPWGLYDMHGNVGEWCADWFADAYPSGDAVDPQGAPSGSSRVVRGGAWTSQYGLLRSARRHHYAPNLRDNFIGLRCVLAIGEP